MENEKHANTDMRELKQYRWEKNAKIQDLIAFIRESKSKTDEIENRAREARENVKKLGVAQESKFYKSALKELNAVNEELDGAKKEIEGKIAEKEEEMYDTFADIEQEFADAREEIRD